MENTAAVSKLFSAEPTILKPVAEIPVEDTEDNKPYKDPKLSLAQIKERESRTVFVGNVNLNCKRITLKKLFAKHGKIESVWFRSVPVGNESKKPIKGKVALKEFVEHADSMNCYILFDTKEEAEAACGENNSEFLGKYLRVSLANQKEHDTKTTIFVGNLYYKAKEEEVRDHFKDCGEIHTIRIIRDPITHMGKGFAYIRFASKQGYLQGLKMNMSEFMTRQLRVKRAVDIEEENKKRDTIKQNEREKYALFGKRKHEPEPMLTETQKAEDVKMHEFSKSRNMEDQMTPDRASEIYKTKGKVPQNQIRGQLKKIKKLGLKGEEATKQVNWVKEKAQRRMGERIFYKRDELKHRREVRKIKKRINVDKSKAMKRKTDNAMGSDSGIRLKRG